MANSDDQSVLTRPGTGEAGKMLFPSGALLPPSGANLIMDGGGGDAIAEGFARAATEAKELAMRATEVVAERTPAIKKTAQEAGARVGELAGKALKEGAASAHLAKATLADPARREALIAANKRKIAIGLAIAIVVAGGGWGFAKHKANVVARDAVEAFLVRNHLRDRITYEEVSGSPFGSAGISEMKVKVSGTTAVTIGTLEISNLDIKGDELKSLSLAAKRVEVPVLHMARENRRDETAIEAIGMGYTVVRGDIVANARFDEQTGTLSLETSGDLRDIVTWALKLDLGGVSPATLSAIPGLARAVARENGVEMLVGAGRGMQSLTGLTLSQANLALDNSGYVKRAKEVTDADIPDAGSKPIELAISESDLVKAGMSPPWAKASYQAMEVWTAKGGRLNIESNLAQPVPLFKRGNFFDPSFGSLPEFLTVTRSKISM